MIQKYNRYKILQVFFDNPTKNFQLREISRNVNLGLPSVTAHIKALEKEKGNIYSVYKANKTKKFKIYKRNNILIRLHESGLIDFLLNSLSPNVIVLFGSASRGDDIETSDIDLFIQSKQQNLKLEKYEKILKRKINLLFEEKIKDMPKELLNNIINGITIHGYLKVL